MSDWFTGFLMGIFFAVSFISLFCYYDFRDTSSFQLIDKTYICALEVNK